MTHQHDTYDRRIQLGASRRRREDAEALYNARRWTGSIYMAGYAIECSLCALICYQMRKNNLKETRQFKEGLQGASLHNLVRLLGALPTVQKAIRLDTTGKLQEAWEIITSQWQKDALRYWDRLGDEQDSKRFMEAVKLLHSFILRQQGEAS